MRTPELATKTPVSILSYSRLFRETIAAWLRLQDHIPWVATAGSVLQLLHRLEGRAANVLLAHTRIDGALGRELVWDAKTLMPSAHLIVLGFRQSEQDLVRWIEAGAMAYVEHDASPGELLQTIRDVAQGCPRCSLSPFTRVIGRYRQITCKAAHLDGRPTAEPLCDRELESAVLLPAALPKGQIGRRPFSKAGHAEDPSPASLRKTRSTARA
jgi:DNA-binding NarL/FixJ family response regulator